MASVLPSYTSSSWTTEAESGTSDAGSGGLGRRVPIAWDSSAGKTAADPVPPPAASVASPPLPPTAGSGAPGHNPPAPLASTSAMLPQPQPQPQPQCVPAGSGGGPSSLHGAAPLLDRLLILPDAGDAVAMLAGTAIGAALTRTVWGVLRLRAVQERRQQRASALPTAARRAMPAAADFPATRSRAPGNAMPPASACSTPRTASDWSAVQSPTVVASQQHRPADAVATVRRGARGVGPKRRGAGSTPSPTSSEGVPPPPPDVTVCRLARRVPTHAPGNAPPVTAPADAAGLTAAAFTRAEQVTAAAFTPPIAAATTTTTSNAFDADVSDADGADDIATEAPLRNAPGSEWMMVK